MADQRAWSLAVSASIAAVGVWHVVVHRVLGIVDYDMSFADVWSYLFAEFSPHLIGGRIASAAEFVAITAGVAGLFARSPLVPILGITACQWFLAWVTVDAGRHWDNLAGAGAPILAISVIDAALWLGMATAGWVWALVFHRRYAWGMGAATVAGLTSGLIVATA